MHDSSPKKIKYAYGTKLWHDQGKQVRPRSENDSIVYDNLCALAHLNIADHPYFMQQCSPNYQESMSRKVYRIFVVQHMK